MIGCYSLQGVGDLVVTLRNHIAFQKMMVGVIPYRGVRDLANLRSHVLAGLTAVLKSVWKIF